MAYPDYTTPRSLAGAATPTYLSATLISGYTSGQALTLANTAGWYEVSSSGTATTNPLGTSGVFTLVVDYGLGTEEKILCASGAITIGANAVIPVWTDGTYNGRGWDGTTPYAHAIGTSSGFNVFPVRTAVDDLQFNTSASMLTNNYIALSGTVSGQGSQITTISNNQIVDETNINNISIQLEYVANKQIVDEANIVSLSGSLATLSGQFVALSGSYASTSGSLNTVSGVAYGALQRSGGTISGALNITSPIIGGVTATSGQAIVWNSTQWVPATVSGGGSGGGITSLTGDVTATGTGAVAATLVGTTAVSGVVNAIINANSTVTGTVANLATLSGQFVTLSGAYNTTSGIVTGHTSSIALISGNLNTVSGVAYGALQRSGGTISGALTVLSGLTASGAITFNGSTVPSGVLVNGYNFVVRTTSTTSGSPCTVDEFTWTTGSGLTFYLPSNPPSGSTYGIYAHPASGPITLNGNGTTIAPFNSTSGTTTYSTQNAGVEMSFFVYNGTFWNMLFSNNMSNTSAGKLSVNNGGTGSQLTATSGSMLIGNGSVYTNLAIGTSGTALVSNGATAAWTGNFVPTSGGTISGSLTVTGAITVGSEMDAGNLNVGGNITVTGTATQIGNATFSGTVAVTSGITGQYSSSTGLTGATAGARFVGGTVNGAPTSGTWTVGDFVIDQTATVWVYTGSTAGWSTTISNHLVLRSATATVGRNEITVFTGAAGQTLSTPSNPIDGSSWTLINNSANPVTLSFANSMYPLGSGSSVTTYTLSAYGTLSFVNYNGGNWYMTNSNNLSNLIGTLSLTSNVTGTLAVANGGTNLTSVGSNGTVLTSNGSSLSYATPVAMTPPSLNGLTAWTYDAATNTVATGGLTLATSTVYFMAVYLQAGVTYSNVYVIIATGVGSSYVTVGLYNATTQLAVTGNIATTPPSNTQASGSFGTAYTPTNSGVYWLGIITSTAASHLFAYNQTTAAAINVGPNTVAANTLNQRCSTLTGFTSLPTTISGTPAVSGSPIWVGLS